MSYIVDFIGSYVPQLYDTHNIRSLRKTLAEIDAEGELQADGSLIVYAALTMQKWYLGYEFIYTYVICDFSV